MQNFEHYNNLMPINNGDCSLSGYSNVVPLSYPFDADTSHQDKYLLEEDAKNSGNTLFIFYIPSNWENQELRTKFEQFGEIESVHVCRKADRSSRGYGFVKFTDSKSAVLAVKKMNGIDVGDNKRLKVQFKTNGNVKAFNKSGNCVPSPGCTIFVFHLPTFWTDSHLKQHFFHFGRIIQCTVQRDSDGKSRGFGFVSFDTAASALNAITGMDGFSVGSKYLKVTLKKGDEQHLEPQLTMWSSPNNMVSQISKNNGALMASHSWYVGNTQSQPTPSNPIHQQMAYGQDSHVGATVMSNAMNYNWNSYPQLPFPSHCQQEPNTSVILQNNPLRNPGQQTQKEIPEALVGTTSSRIPSYFYSAPHAQYIAEKHVSSTDVTSGSNNFVDGVGYCLTSTNVNDFDILYRNYSPNMTQTDQFRGHGFIP